MWDFLSHILGTAKRIISFSYLAGIFLVGSDPGEIGKKLLFSVSSAAKRLKDMSLGLCIVYLIVHFYLESVFVGKKYSSKPLLVILRWLLVVFPCSSNLSNYIRHAPRNNVRR